MTVLCYHAVDPSWDSPLALLPEDFEAQCADLARSGRVVPAGPDVRRRDHVLTFDDGFASLMQHAVPALTRHRLPATVFIVAGTLAEPPTPVNWIRPEPEEIPAVMTAEDVLALVEAGISIGSHTWAHAELPELTEEECLKDLMDSRELLEDLIHAPVPLLAYPFGFHAAHVRRAAERAGYTLAYSLPEQREPVGRYAVPRAGIYRSNSLRSFKVKASPLYLGVRMSRPYGWLRDKTSS